MIAFSSWPLATVRFDNLRRPLSPFRDVALRNSAPGHSEKLFLSRRKRCKVDRFRLSDFKFRRSPLGLIRTRVPKSERPQLLGETETPQFIRPESDRRRLIATRNLERAERAKQKDRLRGERLRKPSSN